MGVWRRNRRAVAAAGLAVAAAGGIAACDPGGPNAAAVAYTTDRTATAELNRQHASVRWLTCTAHHDDAPATTAGSAAPSASRTTVASVDCQGRTDDGREITVTGEVTRAVDGACVRGDLTAKVGGTVRFRVNGLGDCDATAAPTYRPPGSGTHRPTGEPPEPTVTVTVTRTIWCQGDPTCWPVEGK
ncbi:hypothetical protein [Streptomyces mexicanus]|uniref:hypothetical protein n=1 Tax=Streptomyces mexicanus TaxID=178566 RepID=UPI0031E54C16